MSPSQLLTIRPAEPRDSAQILTFIHELAVYEEEPQAVVASEDDICARLFDPAARVHALIAETSTGAVGFAVYFLNFSTWLGRHGLFLEDLYIASSARGQGYGRALLAYLARLAVDNGYGRFEWNVLDWNTPAIGFYEALGAAPQSEWIGYRLEGASLAALAAEAGSAQSGGGVS